MPRVVDHQQRRAEIIQNSWRLIAEQGLAGMTMRQLTTRMGMAHGALNPYFSSKDEILTETFRYVVAQTDQRIARHRELRGFNALRAIAEEIMPVTPDLRLEARVVVAFWAKCLTHPELAAIHTESLSRWHALYEQALQEAVADGFAAASTPHTVVATMLDSLFSGMQVLSATDPSWTPASGRAQFEQLLASLKA